jgi:phosphoadenosine phosphosulfate reductase
VSVFADTLKLLQGQAKKHKSVLVSYSGGKDSLACLDLCARAFPQVVAVYMYLVPGLQVIDERLQWARERYGIEILQYPHWVLYKCLREGIYCNNHHSFDDVGEVTLSDVYAMIRQDTGIRLIAHGGKDSDGLWRRRWFSATSKGTNYADLCYPIKGWSKYDTLVYLQAQKIPIPEESITGQGGKSTAAGIDLSTHAILWLHDTYPEDFRRVCKLFPYAEAVVRRREWHGVS